MNKKPQVSVVIPAYNEEEHLEECLIALEAQTVKPLEIIVVDNNSKDKTVEIAKRHKTVKLIKEKKQGLYFSRQTGMAAAKGDVIGKIDADTIVDEHWVEVLEETFSDPGVFAATGPVGYHDMPFPMFTKKAEHAFLQLARLTDYQFLMGANMAVRKTAWDKIKDELCNEPHLFEDIDIAIHMLSHNMAPSYIPRMSALVSSRRFEDKPSDFANYIDGHSRTQLHHNVKVPAGAKMAEAVFLMVYFGVKPLHMAYDPKLRRPSLQYFMKDKKARPDPMNVPEDD